MTTDNQVGFFCPLGQDAEDITCGSQTAIMVFFVILLPIMCFFWCIALYFFWCRKPVAEDLTIDFQQGFNETKYKVQTKDGRLNDSIVKVYLQIDNMDYKRMMEKRVHLDVKKVLEEGVAYQAGSGITSKEVAIWMYPPKDNSPCTMVEATVTPALIGRKDKAAAVRSKLQYVSHVCDTLDKRLAELSSDVLTTIKMPSGDLKVKDAGTVSPELEAMSHSVQSGLLNFGSEHGGWSLTFKLRTSCQNGALMGRILPQAHWNYSFTCSDCCAMMKGTKAVEKEELTNSPGASQASAWKCLIIRNSKLIWEISGVGTLESKINVSDNTERCIELRYSVIDDNYTIIISNVRTPDEVVDDVSGMKACPDDPKSIFALGSSQMFSKWTSDKSHRRLTPECSIKDLTWTVASSF